MLIESRSLFIFNWVECRPDKMSIPELEEVLRKKWGEETKQAFRLRFSEQKARGLMTSDGTLTLAGRTIYKIALLEVRLFQLPGWEKNRLWDDKGC